MGTLYGQVPKDAHGRGIFGAFGDVVISGPVLHVLHAIVGTLIVVSAATAVVRAILIRNTGFIAPRPMEPDDPNRRGRL